MVGFPEKTPEKPKINLDVAEDARKLHTNSIELGNAAIGGNRTEILKEAAKLMKGLDALLKTQGITLEEADREAHRVEGGYFFPGQEKKG